MQSYDLIVIGSGPAGQRAAIQGAKSAAAWRSSRNARRSAEPVSHRHDSSKTMREAVLHLSGYQYQSIYGMNYRLKERITMSDLSFRVQHVIKTEVDVTQAQLSRNNIEVLFGIASFTSPNIVRVENLKGVSEYEAPFIIIATGTRPAVSAKVPLNNTTIINSDQILQMPEIPKSMIVVGGGVIGCRIYLYVRHSRRPYHSG